MTFRKIGLGILALSTYLTCTSSFASSNASADEAMDPPEITLGERLFLETRFAQAYYAHPGKPDPALALTLTTGKALRGPFAGKTMNCRSCHMVDEHVDNPLAGMRNYSDFARLSPIPARQDRETLTHRNSMSLVNIAIQQQNGVLLHFDGEFNSLEDLVRGTLVGRNYGWLPGEQATAFEHLAQVIREDDGQGELAKEFGGSYRKILTGTDKSIPAEFRLPPAYRVDVAHASDQQLVDAIAKLIAAYVRDLNYAQDEDGHYIGSPYDAFLAKNQLPRKPGKNESPAQYSQRLAQALSTLSKPKFVSRQDGKFETHKQAFQFGPQELAGMALFFTRGNNRQRGGNCIACHSAPHFSDYGFHNTGLTQFNYDQLHGAGAFAQLTIPPLATRNAQYNDFLPATATHPTARGLFRARLNPRQPAAVDLGLWNVFANPDMPAPQSKLRAYLCRTAKQRKLTDCDDASLLPMTLAAFKTPVLRDLGHSAPYMHSGQFDDLQQAVNFYVTAQARNVTQRNPDPALTHIYINAQDVEKLVAFLRALNEDYD